MQPRHTRLLAITITLTSLITCIACYLFVAFHYHHIWSLFCNVAFFFALIITPNICLGYRTDDPIFILKDLDMTEDTYRNWRDCSFITSGCFYLLTYLMPVVPWYATDGVALRFTGVLIVYWANLAFGVAYIGFIKVFVVDAK